MSTKDRIEQYISDWKAQGFDAPTAFVMYQELNAIDSPRVLNPVLATDKEKELEIVMGRLQASLQKVKTPQDWTDYCQTWAATAVDRPTDQEVPIADKLTLMRSIGTIWKDVVPQESHTDLTNRLTMMAHENGTERYVLASEGMTWERLEQVMARHAMSWTWDKAPKDKNTLTAAQENLQKSLTETSVRSIRWNWIDGNGPDQYATMAQGLMAGQASMQERTQWEGPVLGLQGRLHISFGSEHTASGKASPLNDGTTLVETSTKSGWGVVSHEWMHALDQGVAKSQGINGGHCLSDEWKAHAPLTERGSEAQQGMTRAFNTILKQILTEDPGPDAWALGMQDARDSWADRMLKAYPWADENIKSDREALNEGTWDAEDAAQVWAVDFQKNGCEKTEAVVLAQVVISEIEFLMPNTNHSGTSIWREYLERFDQNLIRRGITEYAGYFQEPAEALAHSFESTFFQKNAPVTDVHAGQVGLRYPTKNEGAWHAEGWQRFFEMAKPGWCEIAGIPFKAAPEVGINVPFKVPSLKGVDAKLQRKEASNEPCEMVTVRKAARQPCA